MAYNSQQQANDGFLGYGWSLPIPSIERINRAGVSRMYDEPVFNSSLSGELVPLSLDDGMHGRYGALVEDGGFLVYAYNIDESWTVEDKLGRLLTLGATANEREHDPVDDGRVWRWFVSEVRDRNGNYVAYAYVEDGNRLYPSEITYTGHDDEEGAISITLGYATRPDTSTSFAAGFEIQTTCLLDRVAVSIGGAPVQELDLEYSNGVNGSRSLLQRITETGFDDDGTMASLPPTSFTYSSDPPSWAEDTSYELPEFFFSFNSRGSTTSWGHFGDGLPDLLRYREGETNAVYLNKGDESGWTLASYDLPAPISDEDGNYNCFRPASFFADVNADGLTDILQVDPYGVHGGNNTIVYINTGNGWVEDDGPVGEYHQLPI